MSRRDPQLNADGQLQHLLTMAGLKHHHLERIFAAAQSLKDMGATRRLAVPLLRGRTVCNLFFEPSTRTRSTFELAAQRLSANVLTMDIGRSSTSKGESLLDTLATIEAMDCDLFVVRHQMSGAAHFIARHAGEGTAVLNAGDGAHAHPTQALLDLFTIRQHKPDFTGLKVALVGDIAHSRVARSQIHALNIMHTDEVRVVAPKTLLPRAVETLGVRVFHDIERGLDGVDVVIMLRLQRERMRGALIPSEREYFARYGLTADRLARAKADAIVMHPGPINRGIEIASDIADGPQSVILEQVANGLAIRMAVMAQVMGAKVPGASS